MKTTQFEPERSWPVHEDYQIDAGYLRPVGEVQHRFSPEERDELPFEIAKLAKGREVGIVRFARSYGLLGYYETWERETPLMERLGADVVPGDPVDWIRGHARNLGKCVSILERLALGKRLTKVS